MSRQSPDDCNSLTDLRVAIDRLDTELFDGFAVRMAYIHRAAELKQGTGIPADIPERVEEVVDNARKRAIERGLDPELYAGIWRAVVAAAIAEEERRLA